MKRLVVAMSAAFAAIGAWAGTEKVGDYTWSYEAIDGVVTIVEGENQAAVSPKPTGSVTIPDKLGGLPVARIGQSAFYGCSGMTGVAIPDTVTYIGMKAFSGCSKLSILELPYKVDTIEMDALSGCTSLKTLCLSHNNFAGKAISSIVNLSDCPASMEVRYCGQYRLDDRGRFWCYYQNIYGKSGSISLWRGTELKNIKSRSAYGSVYSDTSVSVPSEISFSNGSKFKVTSIGSYAFKNHEMTSVTIPSTVTNIGSYAFVGCKLASVAIPDSVKRIGQCAFKGCISLESVTTGDGVESIGSDAFADCISLRSVTFGSSVRTIASSAFYGCTALENVVIPAGVTYIDSEAFDCCSGLKSFTVASGNTEYKSVSGLLLTKDGTTLVQGVNGSVTIPNGVKTIGFSAFYELDNLTSVTIPEGVEIIGDYAFGGCYMQFVDIPASVTSIGSGAFSDCPDLIDATIRSRVANIGSGAFGDCSSLTDVYLPKSFAGKIAFDALPSGATIKYLSEAYTILFHRYDGSDEKTEAYEFDYGVATALPKLNELGWARRGFDFKGWATSQANAANGKVWKTDGATVSTAAAVGKVLEVWAVWELRSDSYAIQFIRNDGAGTWAIVGFKYGVTTRMPTLAKGLGWARRGYQFNGWALTAANANNNVIWKGDWANIAEPTAAGTMLTVYASWSLKPGYYQVRFNKNDGTGKWRTLGFECGVSSKLNTIAGLGWTRAGHPFKGWGSNKANADAGKVWKTDGAWVKDATAEGKTLSIYAIWE